MKDSKESRWDKEWSEVVRLTKSKVGFTVASNVAAGALGFGAACRTNSDCASRNCASGKCGMGY